MDILVVVEVFLPSEKSHEPLEELLVLGQPAAALEHRQRRFHIFVKQVQYIVLPHEIHHAEQPDVRRGLLVRSSNGNLTTKTVDDRSKMHHRENGKFCSEHNEILPFSLYFFK